MRYGNETQIAEQKKQKSQMQDKDIYVEEGKVPGLDELIEEEFKKQDEEEAASKKKKNKKKNKKKDDDLTNEQVNNEMQEQLGDLLSTMNLDGGDNTEK